MPPEEVKADEFPLNARVSIDYTKPKGERISFSYPDFDNNRYKWAWRMIMPTLVFIWVMIIASVFFIVGIAKFAMEVHVASAGAGHIVIDWIDWIGIGKSMLAVAGMLSAMFGPPFLMSLYMAKNYDKFSKWLPKFNYMMEAFLKGLHRCTVTKLDGTAYEIPFFDNIYMNYKATGEFGRYLERIDVIEHPFKFVKVRGKKEISEPNDSIWRAVFKFSAIPSTGMLEVNYI